MNKELPGVELHTHLEGSVTPRRLMTLADRYGQPGLLTSCLNSEGTAYVFDGFFDFLDLFRKVTLLLKSPTDFFEVAMDLGQALYDDGVGYAEVSLSYGVMLKRNLDPLAIQRALADASDQVFATHGVRMRWLPDAVRQWGLDQGWYAFEAAAKAGRSLGVVGFGLGGDETAGPARDFAPLFADVKAEGLGVSIHAGEMPSTGQAAADSVRQAVEECGAQRIGHGLGAVADPLVMAMLKARNIFVELCPGSNLCTGAIENLSDHPLQDFLAAGIPCGLNPDDRSLFGLDRGGELKRAQQELGLNDDQMVRMDRWAREAVFGLEEITNSWEETKLSKKPSFISEPLLDSERRAWIYNLKGKFVGTGDCYSFVEEAREKINSETPHIVLSMSDISIINSTGVGMIASLMTASKDAKGKLYLIEAPASARRQLEVTRVWDFLTPLDSPNDLPANLDI